MKPQWVDFGITWEVRFCRDGQSSDAQHRQPIRVAFEPIRHGPAGTLDIEDMSGTKTLINFVQPMPVFMTYASAEIVAVGAVDLNNVVLCFVVGRYELGVAHAVY